ncbi:MAG TPA: hypothetical protein VJB06_01660, partial [archaeon]|nr:hypothetical protein [archaeon]
LYSKYMTESKGDGEVHIIFYWDKIGNESKRVLLSKKLYGYRLKKSKYKGLIELTGSIKLGTNCILISLDNSRKFVDLFDSLGITAKRIHVSKI